MREMLSSDKPENAEDFSRHPSHIAHVEVHHGLGADALVQNKLGKIVAVGPREFAWAVPATRVSSFPTGFIRMEEDSTR